MHRVQLNSSVKVLPRQTRRTQVQAPSMRHRTLFFSQLLPPSVRFDSYHAWIVVLRRHRRDRISGEVSCGGVICPWKDRTGSRIREHPHIRHEDWVKALDWRTVEFPYPVCKVLYFQGIWRESNMLDATRYIHELQVYPFYILFFYEFR